MCIYVFICIYIHIHTYPNILCHYACLHLQTLVCFCVWLPTGVSLSWLGDLREKKLSNLFRVRENGSCIGTASLTIAFRGEPIGRTEEREGRQRRRRWWEADICFALGWWDVDTCVFEGGKRSLVPVFFAWCKVRFLSMWGVVHCCLHLAMQQMQRPVDV